MSEPVDVEWLKSLQTFIDNTLSPAIRDPVLRHKFISRDAMYIWVAAFTHETFSPENNYETLEYAGDIVLKWAFPRYLMRRFPTINNSGLTILNTNYMSKMYQATLSRKMGLSAYIRARNTERIHNLDTDVFESFFGALERVGDGIQDGSGCGHCYNMLIHVLRDTKFDISEEVLRGPAKTQVQQIFGRFLSAADAKPIETYENKIATLTFTDKHIELLASYGVEITDPVLATGRGNTKIEAEKVAYSNALQYLKSIGIDYVWAENARNMLDFSAPGIADYADAAYEKLNSQGFSSMKFYISSKTTTEYGAVVQLLGIKPDGKKSILASVYAENINGDYSHGRLDAIRAYVQG